MNFLNVITEFFKFQGNQPAVIIAAFFCLTSFFNIGFANKEWTFTIREIPNWYLSIFAIIFLISHFLQLLLKRSGKKSETKDVSNKNTKKETSSWLKKFQGIEVEPLSMYGFEKDASPAITMDVSCVHVMWADPRGNSIKVHIDEGTCHIRFNNTFVGSYPSDVTVRPAGHRPLANFNKDNISIFHPNLIISIKNISEQEVSVGLRVVDRLGTQWSYAKGPDYHIITELKPQILKEIVCPLTKKECWQLFTPDGNREYHSDIPDFSMISAIVFEVGGPNGNRRPGVGCGELLLKSIYLRGNI